MLVNSLHSTPRVSNTVWCMRRQRRGVLSLQCRRGPNKPINMYTNRHVNIVRMHFCGVIWQVQQQHTKTLGSYSCPEATIENARGEMLTGGCFSVAESWSAHTMPTLVTMATIHWKCIGKDRSYEGPVWNKPFPILAQLCCLGSKSEALTLLWAGSHSIRAFLIIRFIQYKRQCTGTDDFCLTVSAEKVTEDLITKLPIYIAACMRINVSAFKLRRTLMPLSAITRDDCL